MSLLPEFAPGRPRPPVKQKSPFGWALVSSVAHRLSPAELVNATLQFRTFCGRRLPLHRKFTTTRRRRASTYRWAIRTALSPDAVTRAGITLTTVEAASLGGAVTIPALVEPNAYKQAVVTARSSPWSTSRLSESSAICTSMTFHRSASVVQRRSLPGRSRIWRCAEW